MKTTRQKIRTILEDSRTAVRPTTIKQKLGDEGIEIGVHEVVEHLEHIGESVNEKTLFAKPPKCRACGFEDFDKVLNIPSRCPDCTSEWVEEPEFKIR